jgi:hypothetical protein
MPDKRIRRNKTSRTEATEEQEDTRPKGPAAAGFTRQQGTRKFRRQRSNS